MQSMRIVRKSKGLSLLELSEITHLSVSALSHYENGERTPNYNTLLLIANALEVSVDELVGNKALNSITDGDELIAFSVIGSVKAGYGGYPEYEYTGEAVQVPKSLLMGRKKSDFIVLKVRGYSMYPMLLENDKLLVKLTNTVDSGKMAVVLYGDEATVKYVKYDEGCDWLDLIPQNPTVPPIHVEGAELEKCKVIGAVINLIRSIPTL